MSSRPLGCAPGAPRSPPTTGSRAIAPRPCRPSRRTAPSSSSAARSTSATRSHSRSSSCERGQSVLERLRSRFRFVYLDEYQDTDVAQRELVKLVAADATAVCAVGDVDQGIFGWRGATIHNMFAFGDDFPGARFETLSTNFRSGKRILDLANALIEEWERPRDEQRKLLVPAADAPEAFVEAFVAPHQLDEAEEIASRIAAAGEPWSQYAVLTRTRGDFDPIYRALAAREVPVEVDTLGGFWTRPEILDVVAWLRVLDDPGDNLALGRLLLGPAYRLGFRDLFFLAERAKDENYRIRRSDRDVLPYKLADSITVQHEIAQLSDDARERITRFVASWRELAGIATRVSLADLVGEIARSSGLAAELAGVAQPGGGARAAAPGEAARRRAGLPAGRRLARPGRLRRLPRLPRRGRAGRGRAPRDRGERGTAAHPPPRKGARMGRRLPARPGEGAHAPPRQGREQPDRALGTAAVRAPRRPPLPPAASDDEGAARPAPRRRGAAADVRRHHPRAPPARPLARVVLPRQHRRQGALALLGGGARDRARHDREHRLPSREPVPLGR